MKSVVGRTIPRIERATIDRFAALGDSPEDVPR
jgi:hypothetical protein